MSEPTPATAEKDEPSTKRRRIKPEKFSEQVGRPASQGTREPP